MTYDSAPDYAVEAREVMIDPRDHLAVALDFPSERLALELVDRLEGQCRWFKVGMELFYSNGAGIIETLRGRGFDVFLDLKLHDIPNTVASAIRIVAETGASLLTLHASGGERMMRAAAEAAMMPGAPRLVAVTVLTSMDGADLEGVGINETPKAQARRLAKLAKTSGILGVVCSAEEVAVLRMDLGAEAMLVVPGIRPQNSDIGDQRRIATPFSAISDGASLLVVGRPITRAIDPARAVEAILREIRSGRPL